MNEFELFTLEWQLNILKEMSSLGWIYVFTENQNHLHFDLYDGEKIVASRIYLIDLKSHITFDPNWKCVLKPYIEDENEKEFK